MSVRMTQLPTVGSYVSVGCVGAHLYYTHEKCFTPSVRSGPTRGTVPRVGPDWYRGTSFMRNSPPT